MAILLRTCGRVRWMILKWRTELMTQFMLVRSSAIEQYFSNFSPRNHFRRNETWLRWRNQRKALSWKTELKGHVEMSRLSALVRTWIQSDFGSVFNKITDHTTVMSSLEQGNKSGLLTPGASNSGTNVEMSLDFLVDIVNEKVWIVHDFWRELDIYYAYSIFKFTLALQR